MYRWLAMLYLIVAAAPASGAETRAFVLTTDFSTGSLSVNPLGTTTVAKDVAAVYSDAVERWFGGLLYVVNRFGQDNIQVIDPAQGYATIRQFSTGNGTNPQDICFVSPTKAYITRYEVTDLLIVNPSTGASLGVIPLGAFADADGIPEMAHMMFIATGQPSFSHHRVFVALQRLDRHAGFQPTDKSLVAVIDADADTVLDVDPITPGKQAIQLTGKNPTTPFAFDRSNSRLLIGCSGVLQGVLDGGIESIDPTAMTSLGYVITEAALGGDIGSIAWNGAAHSYAIVSDASYNTSLVSWSAITGQKIATIFAPGGFSLSDCKVDDRGELYVCDSDLLTPGLYVFHVPDDAKIAGPLDCGLPPYQVTFDATSDEVLAVGEETVGASLSSPWPDPARSALLVRLTLKHPGKVEVEALDLAGRRVRVIAAGELPAGGTTLAWDLEDADGRPVPAGLYVVRARTPEAALTRRVAVVR